MYGKFIIDQPVRRASSYVTTGSSIIADRCFCQEIGGHRNENATMDVHRYEYGQHKK